MKAAPANEFTLWRHPHLFNIDFAGYRLSHHHFARHFHDHYVIELVTSGVDSFYCDGKNYTAENNQLVLINPGEVHTGNTVSDTLLQYYSLYPDKKALEQVAVALEISLPENFYFQQALPDRPLLSAKLQLLFNSLNPENTSMEQEEIFFDCMHELLQPGNSNEQASIQAHQKDRRVQLLIDFIRSHYKDDISLQQLAGMVCLNPYYLIRFFKKSVGISPYNYLLIIRAEHAKQLLRNGAGVQDAAIASGFYDASHFNRTFYKIAGTSPKSFRSSKSQDRTSFTA